MRYLILLLTLSFGAVLPAAAEVSIGIGIGLPSVSIGFNMPVYPQFVPVPGYPVYYDPAVDANYFFYDGMYWVYQDDNWYASSWYNGPWALVSPMVVPVYILQVPVRYYRAPPAYFRGWRAEAPPRWGDHWGGGWQRQRAGWDQMSRSSAPPPAPLPTYQRQYSGSKYPSYEQQRAIGSQNYHYQPHEPVVQQHYQQYVMPRNAASSPSEPTQQQRHQQPQPSGQERDSPGPGDNSARQPRPDDRPNQNDRPRQEDRPKQDDRRDEGGDRPPDKDSQRDNR